MTTNHTTKHTKYTKRVKGKYKMPRTLPFDAAKSHLRELVEGMVPGEELVLTSQGEPIAVVVRPPRWKHVISTSRPGETSQTSVARGSDALSYRWVRSTV